MFKNRGSAFKFTNEADPTVSSDERIFSLKDINHQLFFIFRNLFIWNFVILLFVNFQNSKGKDYKKENKKKEKNVWWIENRVYLVVFLLTAGTLSILFPLRHSETHSSFGILLLI